MPYRHLTEAGIRRGEDLSFTLRRVQPDETLPININKKVEGFAGGGFYGSVILLGNVVVKTAQPDAFHEFLRQINWPVPFPSQSSETAAQLDYLSGRILGRVIPVATNKEIVVPQTEGYTRLPGSLGFGQVIERVNCRGPRFLNDGVENEVIREARERVWNTGLEFGLEQAAQVHPNNPFGKPNILFNEDGQIVWLDYLPAFRHTGFIKPFFFYRFHKSVREAFNSSAPTYNRIHTDILKVAVRAHSNNFEVSELEDLASLIDSYDEISEEYQARQIKSPRCLFIDDGLSRQMINVELAERLRKNPAFYAAYRAKQIGRLGVRSILDFVNLTPLKLLWSAGPWRNMKRFLTSREYFLESTMLRGMKKALQEGLVTEDEFQKTLDIISKKDLRLYTVVQAGYFAVSRLVDVATVPLAVMAAKSSDPAEWGGAVAAFNTLSPGLIRATATWALGKALGRNFNKMAMFSAIPIAGTYLAVAGQLKRDYGEKEAKVMHYNLRGIVATISKLRPDGGWGSDLEEKLWNAGKKIHFPRFRKIEQVPN